MRVIEIVNPGLFTTVQDAGRYGYRRYGMPVAGAMDQISYKCANWLVGNDLNDAALEITIMGPEIKFLHPCKIAVTGALTEVRINDNEVDCWETQQVSSNDILKIGIPKAGARSYLAISGGLRVNELLGSASTHVGSGFGGYEGRQLRRDDRIPFYPSKTPEFKKRIVPENLRPEMPNVSELYILPGIDWSDYSEDDRNLLFGNTFTISPQSNRMGFRLEGQTIPGKNDNILSRAVNYGTIQVPADGLPIIMGADCQTIGGYRQIANVISADLHRLGQLMPGNTIKFKIANHKFAIESLRRLEQKYSDLFGKNGNKVCIDCIVYRS